MAPENATATLRKALAVGADAAFHVTDPALLGADLTLTAEALAAALRHAGEPYDPIVAGNASTDGIGGLVPVMIAAWLDMPHLSELTGLTLDGTTLTGTCEDADVRAELGLDVEDFSVARTIMTSVAQRPPKEAGQETHRRRLGRPGHRRVPVHPQACRPAVLGDHHDRYHSRHP